MEQYHTCVPPATAPSFYIMTSETWLPPFADPFEGIEDSLAGTDTGEVYDQVSDTIDDGFVFSIQPTPIGSQGEVILVPELPAHNDSNLCNSAIAGDFLNLLSDTRSSDVSDERRFAAHSCDDNPFYPIVKRQRTELEFPLNGIKCDIEQDEQDDEQDTRKNFHCEQWDLRYQDLLVFKQSIGHCGVPNVFPQNPQLAQWVKRQRHQYKLKIEGKHSTLTDEREKLLEDVGFIWDSHESAWMERWDELVAFQKAHGHSNVPTNYEENRPLSVWVKCQRRQYKLYKLGKRSNMTEDRIKKMDMLDFNWNPRNLKMKDPPGCQGGTG